MCEGFCVCGWPPVPASRVTRRGTTTFASATATMPRSVFLYSSNVSSIRGTNRMRGESNVLKNAIIAGKRR